MSYQDTTKPAVSSNPYSSSSVQDGTSEHNNNKPFNKQVKHLHNTIFKIKSSTRRRRLQGIRK